MSSMIRRHVLTLLSVTAVVFGALTPVLASAATSSASTTKPGAGNGLRVSPVRSDLTINPGQTQTVNVTVNNITAEDANFQAVVNDFTATADESGNPAIVFDTSKPVTAHSLRQFVQPIPDFSLRAGEQKTITVTIKVPSNATAGGYYGVVRFTPTSGDPANRQVNLAGSVGSLILVKVPGSIKDQLSIASFDVRKNEQPSSFFTSNKNLNVVVRFQNFGDIQDQPFGKILLKDHSNKTLASYEVNNTDPRGNVLPDSIRRFSIPLTHVGKFGQYKLVGNFGYGTSGQLLSASTTFYVIPVILIIIFILIVAALVFLIFGLPRVVKAYNRRIASEARRGKRF